MKVNSHFVAQSIEVLKDVQDRPFTQIYPDIYKGCNPLIEFTEDDFDKFEKVICKLKKGTRKEEDLDEVGWYRKEFIEDKNDPDRRYIKDFFEVLGDLKNVAYFRLKDIGRSNFSKEIQKEVLPPSLENFYELDNETETYLHPIKRYLVSVERYFRAECDYLAALKKLDEIDVEATTQAFKKLEEEVK